MMPALMPVNAYTTALLVGCLLLGGCATRGGPLPANPAPASAGSGVVANATGLPLKTRLSQGEQTRFLQDYAELLLANGRHSEAQNLLETLHRSHPDERQPLRLLAYAYEAEGRPGLALLAWERLLQQSSAAGDEAEYARLALLNRHFARAEQVYHGWLLRPTAPLPLRVTALNNLGYSRLLQGDAASARHHFEQALQLDPLDRRARGNLALSHEMAGDSERASAEWQILGRGDGTAGQ